MEITILKYLKRKIITMENKVLFHNLKLSSNCLLNTLICFLILIFNGFSWSIIISLSLLFLPPASPGYPSPDPFPSPTVLNTLLSIIYLNIILYYLNILFFDCVYCKCPWWCRRLLSNGHIRTLQSTLFTSLVN